MTWEVRLFGRLQVRPAGDGPSVRFSPLLESLLAYLALQRGRSVARQSVIDVFWGDQPEARARRSLATALWRLRRALERDDAPAAPVEACDASMFLGGGYWLDVAEFERAASVALPVPLEEASDASVRALGDAVDLYRGELLEGLPDDWAVRERERLQLLLEECLAYLMRHFALHGCVDEGIRYGSLLLQRDALREDIHREMMRLYMRSGSRALAVRQYEICREALATELGIAPMEETRRVLQWVTCAAEPDSRMDEPSLADLSAMLERAIEAQRMLQVVIDELSRRTREARPAAPSVPSVGPSLVPHRFSDRFSA